MICRFAFQWIFTFKLDFSFNWTRVHPIKRLNCSHNSVPCWLFIKIKEKKTELNYWGLMLNQIRPFVMSGWSIGVAGKIGISNFSYGGGFFLLLLFEFGGLSVTNCCNLNEKECHFWFSFIILYCRVGLAAI